jgi:hypothetical protein
MSQYIGLIKAVVIAAVLVGLFGYGMHVGSGQVQARWDKANLEAERVASKEQLRKQEIIDVIDTKSVKKKQQQASIDQSIIESVDKNVPSTLPLLPSSFRVLHDAAAAGQKIDDTAKVDADPVAPGTVAKTIARNYQSAREDKTNLEDLQAIVRASGCFTVEGE